MRVAIHVDKNPTAPTTSSSNPSDPTGTACARCAKAGLTASNAHSVPKNNPAPSNAAFSTNTTRKTSPAVNPIARSNANSLRRSSTLRNNTAAIPTVPINNPSAPNA